MYGSDIGPVAESSLAANGMTRLTDNRAKSELLFLVHTFLLHLASRQSRPSDSPALHIPDMADSERQQLIPPAHTDDSDSQVEAGDGDSRQPKPTDRELDIMPEKRDKLALAVIGVCLLIISYGARLGRC